MKQGIFEILSNTPLTDSVYKMVLSGDTSAVTNCGQFVNIQLAGKFLRRPISVCDYDESTLTIIYKVVGSGTEQMSAMTPGEKLDILTGLGNGYDISLSGDHPVLLGGGVGVPAADLLRGRTSDHQQVGHRPPITVILTLSTNIVNYLLIRKRNMGCTVINGRLKHRVQASHLSQHNALKKLPQSSLRQLSGFIRDYCSA